jgi:hypothetical protein
VRGLGGGHFGELGSELSDGGVALAGVKSEGQVDASVEPYLHGGSDEQSRRVLPIRYRKNKLPSVVFHAQQFGEVVLHRVRGALIGNALGGNGESARVNGTRMRFSLNVVPVGLPDAETDRVTTEGADGHRHSARGSAPVAGGLGHPNERDGAKLPDSSFVGAKEERALSAGGVCSGCDVDEFTNESLPSGAVVFGSGG